MSTIYWILYRLVHETHSLLIGIDQPNETASLNGQCAGDTVVSRKQTQQVFCLFCSLRHPCCIARLKTLGGTSCRNKLALEDPDQIEQLGKCVFGMIPSALPSVFIAILYKQDHPKSAVCPQHSLRVCWRHTA